MHQYHLLDPERLSEAHDLALRLGLEMDIHPVMPGWDRTDVLVPVMVFGRPKSRLVWEALVEGDLEGAL